MMEPNKYQEWILETIDSLRSRKARPDLERICRMVRRRHGSDPDRTRAELDKLTQSQAVLKVSYKGSISYRNAAKVLRRSRKNSELAASGVESSKQEHRNNSRDCAQSFTAPEPEEASLHHSESEIQLNLFRNSTCNSEALWCVATEEQGRNALISTTRSIGQQQQQQQGGRQPPHTGHTHSVSSVSSGEVESCGVNFTNNKTHSLPSQSQTLSIEPKLCTANIAQGAASARSLSGASVGHIQSLGLKDILGYLGQQERCRGKGEEVVDRDVARARRWTRCGNMTLGAALEPREKQLHVNNPTQTAGDEERWQGPNEQIKDIPQSFVEFSGPPVAMATDSEAEDAEIQVASRHWTRDKSCTESLSMAIPKQSCGDPEIEGASCLLIPTASPIASSVDEPESFSARSLSPTDWSVSDVVSYFTAAGFPEQAAAFRSQEIDGRSLLLMRRNDVLTGLSIKLGPALKIYEHHVKELQKTQFEEEEL